MKFLPQLSPRAQAVLVLAFVAATGALVGIAGDRLVAQQNDPADTWTEDMPDRRASARARDEHGPMHMPAGPIGMDVRYAERLGTMIDLSPEQQTAIDSIVVQGRRRVRDLTLELEPRCREIATQTRQRVEEVLTAEQVAQLRTMRQQRSLMLREQMQGQRPPGMRQRRALPPNDSTP
ncbi:hypothetical protein BH23GEM10_BH23GEM10_02500 [soil metagenome]